MKCPQCGYELRSTMKRRKPVHRWINGHEYIGIDPVAVTKRRMEVYRAAGGEVEWFDESDTDTLEDHAPAMCQYCAETHPVAWLEGEWHHNCKLKKKCDSVKCALWICPTGHRLLHGRFIGGRPK